MITGIVLVLPFVGYMYWLIARERREKHDDT